MSCIAVTRGGSGDVLRFDSVDAADLCPIVQYGDVVLVSAQSLRDCLDVVECARVASVLSDAMLAQSLSRWAASSVPMPARERDYLYDALWNTMLERAPRPPTDPAQVVEIVIRDRQLTRSEGVVYRTTSRSGHMSDTQTAEATTRPPQRAAKYADTQIITMLNDKDGKPYGSGNNPKRPGSASHTLFEKYTDGMTVADAKAAGITAAALSWDAEKNFISIS